MTDHYTLSNVSKKELVHAFDLKEDEAKLVHRYRNQLPVIFDSEGEDGFCVDMRTLHSQMKVKTNFDMWYKRRLKGFSEEEDFSTFLMESTGGRPRAEYHLTIDCAKQIAMMEGSDTGKLVRKYFILCEKLVIRMARRNPIRHSCKDSTKELYSNISGRVQKGKQAKVMAEMHAIICTVATGARPSMWKKNIGVTNVRDFLKENATHQELTRYDNVAKMASFLTNDVSQTKSSVRKQLEASFGESEIYLNYLFKSGVKDFNQ